MFFFFPSNYTSVHVNGGDRFKSCMLDPFYVRILAHACTCICSDDVGWMHIVVHLLYMT